MTSQQMRLQGTPAPEVRLTERQAFALEVIHLYGPLSNADLGAFMHHRRGKHSGADTCPYCPDEGLAVAKELRAKKDARGRGLVTERRNAGWTLTVRRTADPGELPVDF